MPRIAENPGKWSVNPLNFAPSVTAAWSAPARVGILDSTVRKITGTAGAKYTPDDIAELTQMADRMGVRWIEVNLVHGNMPSTPKLRKMFSAIAKRKHNFLLVGTAFRTKETIDDAIDNGADAVNMGLGSDLAEARKWQEYILSRGAKVAATMGARVEHLTVDQVVDKLNVVAQTPVEYIGIHENTGATSPDAWRYLMTEVHRRLVRDVPIVPHIHNVFGQAVGAAVNAVLGGAKGIDVTLNGIGTHSGMPAFEEVVTNLEILYGIDTGIDMSLLREYSELLERLCRFVPHPNKPITGRMTFIDELDPFIAQIVESRKTGTQRVHGLNPAVVGGEFFPVWGENAIHGQGNKAKLEAMGLPHDADSVRKVNSALEEALLERERRDEYPYYLTEPEFEALARRTVGNTATAAR